MRVRGSLFRRLDPWPPVGGGRLAAILLAFLAAHPLLLAADGADEESLPPPPTAALFPQAASGVVLSRVYAASARDNEFVEIVNLARDQADLAGWSLTDGEATVTFPLDAIVPPGARVVTTRNATGYAEDLLEPADFTWEAGPARRLEGGVLRLADAGDEVVLVDAAGTVVDAYVYGDSTYAGAGWNGPPARAPGRGEVAVRAVIDDTLLDRDDATDWDGIRDHRIGQSAFETTERIVAGPILAAVSPNDGADLVMSFLGSARGSIEVSVYTLTHEGIASVLAGAAARGVRVRVLLDGGPVGGLDEAAEPIASGLAWAGAELRWLRGATDVVKRYRYLHAKYAVVDGMRLLVSSENFGDSGFPLEGRTGNRGWTVALEDARLAADIRAVFEADFDPRRRDSIAAEPRPAWTPAEEVRVPPWSPGTDARTRRVRLLVGPDTALDPSGLLDLLASARDRIWIETFYIEETWRDARNPFLEAAVHAARRGVDVRILLDGSWWNDDPDAEGNDDLVGRLNERAGAEGLRLEARLVAPYGRVDSVHNKGVVVDGMTILVSSMNWAHASATENREVGLILEDPVVAARFEAALLADWTMADGEGFRIGDPAAVAALYAIVGVASFISLRKLRGTSKRLRPPARMGTRGRRGLLRRRGREVRLLPAELVAEPQARPRGGRRARRRRGAPRGRRGGPEGD